MQYSGFLFIAVVDKRYWKRYGDFDVWHADDMFCDIFCLWKKTCLSLALYHNSNLVVSANDVFLLLGIWGHISVYMIVLMVGNFLGEAVYEKTK